MSLLLKAIHTQQWAILPADLALVKGIAGRGDLKALAKAIADRDDLTALGYEDGQFMVNTRKPVELFDSVAVVRVEGVIFPKANIMTEVCGATSVECLVKDLVEVADNPQVKSIVLEFNTPGGSINGINEGAEYIAMIQESTGKKITAYVDGACASAGYWLAASCHEIVLSKTGQVGSIGAVLQYDASQDDGTASLVSSRAKNKRPDLATEAGRELIQATLDDIEDIFLESAAAGRGMTATALAEAGNYGGMLVGQKAVNAGLADRTSNFKTLINDLNASNGTTQHQPRKPTTKGSPMAYETLEQMKADNPVLCQELSASVTAANKSEFEAAGETKERARMTAILGADCLGHEALRTTALTAGTDVAALSLAVIGAETGQRNAILAGAGNADVNNIEAGESEEVEDKKTKRTAHELKAAANAHIKEQAAEGKTVEYKAAVKLAAAGEI